jgi:hypothetical protein
MGYVPVPIGQIEQQVSAHLFRVTGTRDLLVRVMENIT